MNQISTQRRVDSKGESDRPQSFAADPTSRAALDGVPTVEMLAHIHHAAPTVSALPGLLRAVRSARRGPGRLSPAEFFHYRLWDDEFRLGDPASFIGRERQGELHRACNEIGWLAVADDKILTHTILRTAEIHNLPSIRMLYGNPARDFVPVGRLETRDAVETWLRDPDLSYPVFGKPADGIYSLDCFHAVRLEEAADLVIMADGSAIEVPLLAERIVRHPRGFLFQAPLPCHPDLAPITADRLCSVRVLVFRTPGGAICRSAVIKIPTGINMADNYWRPGNRLGAIDLESGRITRVVTGTGLDLRRDPVHPDTHLNIEGVTIPRWNELLSVVERASLAFPGIRTQSWDVALASSGPILLELNWGGDLSLHQFAHGIGLYDALYEAHIKR